MPVRNAEPHDNCSSLRITTTMLTRTLRARGALRTIPSVLRASYSEGVSKTTNSPNQVPANDPVERAPKPNVSATNATPMSSEGVSDEVMVESVERGEELRVMQAPNRMSPNRKGIWSQSQQPKELAMTGPRFEQTLFQDQVCHTGGIAEIGVAAWAVASHMSKRSCIRVGGIGTEQLANREIYYSLDHTRRLSSSTNNPSAGSKNA
jgi:hypothetical protein